MSISVKYVGLDVSKSKITVACADEGGQEARYWGVIEHSKAAVTKLLQQFSRVDIKLNVCYKAGPTGFVMYRWRLELSVFCNVVAPFEECL